MKNLVVMLLASLAVTAQARSLKTDAIQAAECLAQVKPVAQMNLDQKAKSYLFDGSDIENDATLVQIIETKFEKLYKYSITGYIYKATYIVEVTLDSSCGVNKVEIKEVL